MQLYVSIILVLIATIGFCRSQTLVGNAVPFSPGYSSCERQNLYGLDTFSCNTNGLSATPAKNVHELKPNDVQAIAALGNSITRGILIRSENFACGAPDYPGLSFPIGGDGNISTIATLPNILRLYNSNLAGFSTGQGSSIISRYNVAVNGAKTSDLVSQANILISNLTTDNNHNRWKIITIYIGGNDLCDACNSPLIYSAYNFSMHLKSAIDLLANYTTNTFINVLAPPDLSIIETLRTKGCISPFAVPCACVNDSRSFMDQYILQILSLQAEYNLLGREDFAVVYQPYLTNAIFPSDFSNYFAPDCFHLSQRSHAIVALNLWNNMLQPVGEKSLSIDFSQTNINLLCPTSSQPYFFTVQNSGTIQLVSANLLLYICALLCVLIY